MGQETKFFFQKIWLSGASLAVDKHWRTVADSYHVWADAYVGAAQLCCDFRESSEKMHWTQDEKWKKHGNSLPIKCVFREYYKDGWMISYWV